MKDLLKRFNPGFITLAFAGIIFIALALRLWGIWNVSATDEYNEVLEALRVCSGNLNFERWMKRFYLYILSVEYGIYYLTGWMFGTFGSPLDFAEKIVRNMEPLFIMGRITSALAGTATVAMVYRIGSKFHNNSTAIIASLLMTFTVFHIDLSQQAKVDATLGLLVVASMYFLYKLLQTEKASKWDYIFCGLFTALALQTKINAIVLVFPIALIVFLAFNKKDTVLNLLYFSLPAAILGFVLGNPAVVFAPLKFLDRLLGMTEVYTSPVNEVPSDLIGFLAYPLYYYKTMGVVVSLLTVYALIRAFWNHSGTHLLLLSFIVPFYLLMGASKNLVATYYLIPVVPFIYLLIGESCHDILDKIKNRSILTGNKLRILGITVILLALIQPMYKVYVHERGLYSQHTRYVAKQWIEGHIPPDSKILMDSGKSINSWAPDIARNKSSIRERLGKTKQNVEQGKIVHKMVDSNALVYYELLLKTVPEVAYDITSTQFGLNVKSIDYYVENGFDYIVIAENMKSARTNPYFRRKHPKIARFYESVQDSQKLELIKTISPTKYNRGQTYYIYKIRKGF